MVLELPPAPAARVELGRWLACWAARSAALRRRMADLGPPGGVGDDGRPDFSEPDTVLGVGEFARGDEDCAAAMF